MINEHKPIPVILDTDIGDDIDDTWAIAMMLNCTELDPKLVLSDVGNTPLRAREIAKLLQRCGRTDIPVGVGLQLHSESNRQEEWVSDYGLGDYPGTVYENGVDAIIETIRESSVPVTLICIGPVPNIAEALKRDPSIVSNAHFVGMHGSIAVAYGGKPGIAKEYNVAAFPSECAAVFAAPWLSKTITPLDTCGIIRLTGERYRKVLTMNHPGIRAVLENYRVWCRGHESPDPDMESTILYDTVAVYLAYARDLCEIRSMNIKVTEDGRTVEDRSGCEMDVAIAWKDLDGWYDHLLGRLAAHESMMA